jgi:allophanate hydrolase subunit 1
VSEPTPGPSGRGSVVLELGPGAGALVLRTAPELDGREIEVSPLLAAQRRTHARVRPRETGAGTQYAAVYPQLAPGDYAIWGGDDTPAATVTISSGEVTTTWLPGAASRRA